MTDLAAVQEIETLIGRHFDGLSWSEGKRPDWRLFSADFLPGASLFPAARPVQKRTLEQFIDRMEGVFSGGALRSFEEKTLGMRVLEFRNVAVVIASSEMIENGQDVNYDVSGFLLVRSEGKWLIAAHAWDHATEQLPVPGFLR